MVVKLQAHLSRSFTLQGLKRNIFAYRMRLQLTVYSACLLSKAKQSELSIRWTEHLMLYTWTTVACFVDIEVFGENNFQELQVISERRLDGPKLFIKVSPYLFLCFTSYSFPYHMQLIDSLAWIGNYETSKRLCRRSRNQGEGSLNTGSSRFLNSKELHAL